jgi:hypothetical protein
MGTSNGANAGECSPDRAAGATAEKPRGGQLGGSTDEKHRQVEVVEVGGVEEQGMLEQWTREAPARRKKPVAVAVEHNSTREWRGRAAGG